MSESFALLFLLSLSSAAFESKVEAQVAKVITSMMAAKIIIKPSISSLYVTDPFKTDFNPAEKHGASLFSKVIEELPDKDKFTLNTDKAKQLSHVLKTKASTYFWGTSVTNIPQAYPVVADKCKNLLICPDQVSFESIKRYFQVLG